MTDEFDNHWGSLFDAKFLRWFHLKGEPSMVQIEKVYREELTLPGGRKKKKLLMSFKQLRGAIDPVLPLVLNKTNAELISQVVGSPKPKDWIGKTVVLFETKVKFGSEVVPAIRVRAPKEQK